MSGVQETSRIAYREIQPQLGDRQTEVYNIINQATKHGFDMTNMEIAKLLGWSINRVTPRVYELREENHVTLHCRRRCGVTGRMAMAWTAKHNE